MRGCQDPGLYCTSLSPCMVTHGLMANVLSRSKRIGYHSRSHYLYKDDLKREAREAREYGDVALFL